MVRDTSLSTRAQTYSKGANCSSVKAFLPNRGHGNSTGNYDSCRQSNNPITTLPSVLSGLLSHLVLIL